MGLLADLASGKLGLVVAPPDHLTIEAEDATSVAFNATAPGSGHTDIECDAHLVEGDSPSVAVTMEGNPESPSRARGRTAARALRDPAGYVWWIALATTVAVPLAALAEEVDAVVRSWQPLS